MLLVGVVVWGVADSRHFERWASRAKAELSGPHFGRDDPLTWAVRLVGRAVDGAARLGARGIGSGVELAKRVFERDPLAADPVDDPAPLVVHAADESAPEETALALAPPPPELMGPPEPPQELRVVMRSREPRGARHPLELMGPPEPPQTLRVAARAPSEPTGPEPARFELVGPPEPPERLRSATARAEARRLLPPVAAEPPAALRVAHAPAAPERLAAAPRPQRGGFPGLDDLLARADAEVREARFEGAVETIARASRMIDSLPDSARTRPRRARLEVLRATTEVAFGNLVDARASLERALEAEPDLELDPRTTSPKLLRIFGTLGWPTAHARRVDETPAP